MSGILRPLARLLDGALAVAFQPECVLCGLPSPDKALCPLCDRPVPVDPPLCGRCGGAVTQPVGKCGRCLGPEDPLRGLVAARSALWYRGSMRDVVHLVKYGRRRELLHGWRPWCRLPASFLGDGTGLVPVPLHLGRLLHRGFNQAEVLARFLAAAHGLPPPLPGLVKERATEPQSRLGERERRRNLRGVFRWAGREGPPGRVILVDDVLTTGATLGACARALRRAGAKEVLAWTLFRTPQLTVHSAKDPESGGVGAEAATMKGNL